MTIWFGPDAGPGVVCVGPVTWMKRKQQPTKHRAQRLLHICEVRVEKWRKQPVRTLLFGAKSEKTEVGFEHTVYGVCVVLMHLVRVLPLWLRSCFGIYHFQKVACVAIQFLCPTCD